MSEGTGTVTVVGAGIAGLGAAIFLARRGCRVTVLEQDAPPPVDPVTGAPSKRRGTPQAGQSHAYVARCHELLQAEAPEVVAELVAAGAGRIRLDEHLPDTLSGRPTPDPALVVLTARRPVFEAALRRVAEREPGVTIRSGAHVTGLMTHEGIEPRVSGVVLDGGATVPGDLVVDACGRRSGVASWLESLSRPVGLRAPCGISYHSRFFRLRPGAEPGPLNRGYVAGGSFDRYSCLVFPADAGTFSVTFGVLPEDRALRPLGHDDGFLAAAGAVPVVAEWIDPDRAEPICAVAGMHGLVNTLTPPAPGGRPTAIGLVPIGDAALITNPAHTRGTTLGLLSAWFLARAVDQHRGDPASVAQALQESYDRELSPWYFDSVEQDAARLAGWRPGTPPPEIADGRVTNGQAYAAGLRDPVVWRAFTRRQQLLDPAGSVLGDPALVARVRAVAASGWSAPRPEAPSHDQLAELAAALPLPTSR